MLYSAVGRARDLMEPSGFKNIKPIFLSGFSKTYY